MYRTTGTVGGNGSYPIVVAAKTASPSFTFKAVARAGDYVDLSYAMVLTGM